MLFCLVDAETILATPTGMPIVELILQATKSRAAATILSLMLAVCFINGTNASITSVSRLLYAMARDRGIVYHNYFAHIQAGLNVPVRTIMFCFVFNILFGLLYLGPAVAFSAYVASCTIFLNVSYSVPIIVLLIRGRKVLDLYQTPKTHFKLGRVFGYILNVIGALYVVITSIVSQNYSANPREVN
jgi:amino acid transporter